MLMISFAHLPSAAAAATEADEAFLDRVEKEAFAYFWDETNPRTGLTRNTTERGSPASNAAAGFMLSALPIGIERGWITKDEGYARALTTLKSFRAMEAFHGFTYHYINPESGNRMWASEVSSIDTSLFLAGVITIGEYFKGTEVEVIADWLYRKTDWTWFLNGERALQMAWKPERGFFARIDSFSEGIITYILAMGSPTHSIPKESWDIFVRPVSRYGDWTIVYAADGSLFQYLFPLAWLDLRGKHDRYASYWENAIRAVKANKRYCADTACRFRTYREGFWGLSASLSPGGYKNFGAKPGRNKDDGTVAPYAVGGSIPLCPEFAIADYRAIYEKVPEAAKRYGLTDAFNLDRKWICREYISIDIGLTLLMVENYRTGLVWKYFMRSPSVKRGLDAAGFVPGTMPEPKAPSVIPGNPHDAVTVGRHTGEIAVDGDPAEWCGGEAISLTAKDNRNVEMTLGYVKDDTDVSGRFLLTWDDRYLYIAGDVADNEIVCAQRREKLYLDDCVEIFFDTDKNGYSFNGNPHDYQLGIAPSGPDGKPQIWAWGYRNAEPKGVIYAVQPRAGGYRLEAAIPFSEINGFGPKKTRTIGFSVSIHDKDKDSTVKKLTWSIDTDSEPGATYFGTLELGE